MNETDSTLPPFSPHHAPFHGGGPVPRRQAILATELRQTIIRTVAANGGHLAPLPASSS
ncbi:MAG: hypothetical protein ACLR7Z_05890 [Bilophila wadsworthia]